MSASALLPVVQALDAYLQERTTRPVFLAHVGFIRYPYRSVARTVGPPVPRAGRPTGHYSAQHSLRYRVQIWARPLSRRAGRFRATPAPS